MPSRCCIGPVLPLRRLPGAFSELGNLWKRVGRILRLCVLLTWELNMPQLPWQMWGLGLFTLGSGCSGRKLCASALALMAGALQCSQRTSPLTTSFFIDYLGNAVDKAASAFRDYKVLGNCFVLSGLSRPKPPMGRKWKASTLPSLCGKSQSGNWQRRSSCSRNRSRRPKPQGKGNGSQADKPKQQQFLSLLGLIAAMLQSVEYAHLHMHPI